MSNCAIWPINGILSGASSPVQSRPGSNGDEGVFHIFQRSKSGALLSHCLMSYPGIHWESGGLTPSTAQPTGPFY